MSARALAVAILVAAAAVPASAQAARPVLLGPGDAPGVAVDAAGTAHLAYNGPYVNGEPLMYCAWPRGARGCTPRPITADNASPLAQPALLQAGPAPGELTIVSARDGLQVIRSLDGGASFLPPAVIGTGRYFDGAFGPGGQLALSIRNLGYIEYYHRSLAGPPDASAGADLNRGYGVSSQVDFAGPLPVLVSGGKNPGIGVSSWTGQGDIHDPATWAGPFKVARSNYFALASGPRGLFLAHETSAGFPDRMVVRKFTGQRFGKARRIPSGRLGLSGIIGVGLAHDAKGRMVAVWYSASHERLEVSASRTGARWSRARVLATGVDTPSDIVVALGADGRGLVVFDENTGPDVHAVRVSVPALL